MTIKCSFGQKLCFAMRYQQHFAPQNRVCILVKYRGNYQHYFILFCAAAVWRKIMFCTAVVRSSMNNSIISSVLSCNTWWSVVLCSAIIVGSINSSQCFCTEVVGNIMYSSNKQCFTQKLVVCSIAVGVLCTILLSIVFHKSIFSVYFIISQWCHKQISFLLGLETITRL